MNTENNRQIRRKINTFNHVFFLLHVFDLDCVKCGCFCLHKNPHVIRNPAIESSTMPVVSPRWFGFYFNVLRKLL